MRVEPREKTVTVGPTLPAQRIQSLDILRGFALLGILVSNIQVFSMFFSAVLNPYAFGGMTGFNYVVAMLTRVLVSGKFFPIFSMLFGAGIFLMAQKIESKGGNSPKRHVLRMIWLVAFGWLHIFLFWDGDILFTYGVSGLAVFLFRKLSAKTLLIIGLILVFIPTVQTAESKVARASRTPDQLAAVKSYWQPSQEEIDKDISRVKESWTKQMSGRVSYRWSNFWKIQSLYDLVRYSGWMLLGMALFKFGIFTAAFPVRWLVKFLVLGLAVGVPFRLSFWIANTLHNWDFMFKQGPTRYSFLGALLHSIIYQGGCMFIILGYIAGIMLVCRSGKLKRLTHRLAAVGRMALTNYLMHSVICTFLFYGYGFALYGRVDRTGQFLIVLVILAFQLWYSPLWLKHFRFGPAEWLWRSLTYWKLQPMRKQSE